MKIKYLIIILVLVLLLLVVGYANRDRLEMQNQPLVIGGRWYLLSAVAGVTDSLTSFGRNWSLKVLNLFGYPSTTGRII